MTARPAVRTVDQFTGRRAPIDTDEAFELLREENAALRCRLEELEGGRC